MKNKIKYFFLIIFLFIIIFLTINTIISETSLEIVFGCLKSINFLYILICLIMLVLYFALQGVYMKTILKSLNEKISLCSGIYYSLTEFYFSCITPSSTGGQPMQLYCMTKDKIPIRKSYIVLMLNTIYFKLIILILGLFVLIFGWNYILSKSIIYMLFFFLGLVVDLLIVIFSFLILFYPQFIKKVLIILFKFVSKIGVFEKKARNFNIDDFIKRYEIEIKYIKSHTILIVFTFLLTFIQRLLLFSIIYVIYKGLGFSSYNYFDLLMIQISVQMVIEVYPLPGGAGLSEEMINSAFSAIHGLNFAAAGMLLTRTFSFYVPLLISGFTFFTVGVIRKIKNNKRC